MKRITCFSTIITIATTCFFILVFGFEDCDVCYSLNFMIFKLLVCGLAIIGLSFYFAKKYVYVENIIFDIENQPILETNEASNEVSFSCEGKIVSEKTIESYNNKIPCVYYHYILEKLVHSNKSSTWKVVKNKVDFVPFYIEDKRGRLKIDITNIDSDFSKFEIPRNNGRRNPQNSEIDCEVILNKKRFDDGSFLSKTKYRKSEYILRPNVNAYVYGYVSKDDDGLVLREHDEHPLIISRKPQEVYVKEFYKGKKIIYIAHFLAMIGYVVMVYALNYFFSMNSVVFLFLLLLGCFLIIGSVIFTMYNRIIYLKHRALNALSNIDGELKRRNDLIPGLIEIVKAYAEYEKNLLFQITEARMKIVHSEQIEYKFVNNPNKLDSTIFMLREKYPELKTSSNFNNLMLNLTDTEERIAYSRMFYNRSVRKYNTLIKQFPFVILAVMYNMREMKFINFASYSK